MAIERKKLSDYIPDDRNPNQGSERGYGALEYSLRQYGAGRSLLADKNGKLIAGNKTAEKAAELGIEEVIEVETDGRQLVVVRRRDLDLDTDAAARELSVADNRVGELSLTWNAEVLAELAAETDLSQLFRDEELAELLAGMGEQDIGGAGDDFDPSPVEGPARTAPGDLWEIKGAGLTHRLIVGDCTDPAVVARLMGGERADAAVTDPPYGVRYRQGDEKRHWHAAKKRFVDVPIHGDDQPFDPSHLLEAAPLVVLWGANNYADKLPPSRGWLVWDKKPDITSNDFADAELAWTNRDAVVRAFRHRWSGVIRDSQNGDEHYHATEKPIALFEWCFDVCRAGNLIYDPYLGSGTTIIAAQQTGRRCYGCEIEPKWADICLRRAEAAGLTCVRVGE